MPPARHKPPETPDPFDPNGWGEPVGYRTVTLSLDGSVFTIVDDDVYDFVLASGPWRLYEHRTKRYAKRDRRRGEVPYRGCGATVYLHQVIARRKIGPPPSLKHIIVDHKSGDGLDNRDRNLAWSTPKENKANLYGMWWQNGDFIRELDEGRDWYGENNE